MRLRGRKVVLGFSGGPDAAALAFWLKKNGCTVIPVYVHYRQTSGGKTSKDLRHARASAKLLGLAEPIVVRAPLTRVKSARNRHIIRTLAKVAKWQRTRTVALGTVYEKGERDLDPEILRPVADAAGVKLITWENFGVRRKVEEFIGINPGERAFLYRTTSCGQFFTLDCGHCYGCYARHEAFKGAFGRDPTNYGPKSKIGNKH